MTSNEGIESSTELGISGYDLDTLPFFVHSPIQILTTPPDLDVCLIDSIRRAAHLQIRSDALVDLRGITLRPTKDGGVVHVESALSHHPFDIAVRELVSAIPSDAQKYYGRLEVAPLERGFILLQEYDSRGGLAELKGGL